MMGVTSLRYFSTFTFCFLYIVLGALLALSAETEIIANESRFLNFFLISQGPAWHSQLQEPLQRQKQLPSSDASPPLSRVRSP